MTSSRPRSNRPNSAPRRARAFVAAFGSLAFSAGLFHAAPSALAQQQPAPSAAPASSAQAPSEQAPIAPVQENSTPPPANGPDAASARDSVTAAPDEPHAPVAAAPAQAPAATPEASPAATATTQSAAPAPVTPAPVPHAPAAAAPAIATPAAPALPAAPAKPRLKIAAGSGAYADAYEKNVLVPFAAATSVEVIATADTRNLDVVALDGAELDAKCASGDLRELPAELAASDAVADVPSRCGIATFAWASVFVYEPARYAKRAPRTLKDVFNVRGYPGKRALPRNGRGLLEAALVADGVAASEIYARRATPDGRQQALAAIARLGSDIEWFDKADDALELLRAGKAAIALTSNSRAFFDSERRGPLEIIWDGQVYDVEYLAIPKSTANADAAERFVAFATAPERLAAIARQIPYGPMRQQAIASVRTHAITGNDLQPFLPTSAANLASAVRFDPAWWRDNAESVASTVAEASRPRPSGTAPPLPTRQTQR